jgi:hypothetical protein
MHKRLFLHFLAALVFCIAFASSLKASPIGAVVQSWQYDPQANAVTVRIANISGKDITAFNMSVTETFADHSVSTHELLDDMLSAMLFVQQIKGTPDEDRIRKQLGNGTLAAYQSRDQVFNYAKGKVVTDFQATIDVVAYADGTAEATNAPALERLREHRSADVRSHQKANQILKEVLADSTIQNPTDEAVARLQRFLSAQPQSNNDIESGTIEAIVRDVKSAPRVAAARHVSEAEYLKQYAAEKDQHISMLSKHAQLGTGAAQ